MSDEKVDAWMPLWIGAYLADTMKLTTLQHGAYLLLLIAYWRERGPLADDDEELASTIKASAKEWRTLRPKLERFFTIEDGVWRHGRADQELAKAQGHKAKASAKGKAGAQARWEKSSKQGPGSAPGNAPGSTSSNATGNASSIAQALLEQCPTPTPIPPPSEDSEAKASAAAGASAAVDKSTNPESQPIDRRVVWESARDLLVAANIAEVSAREFIGSLVSDFTLPIAAKAVESAVKAKPFDPKAYLLSTCKALKASPSGSQYESAEATRTRLDAEAKRTVLGPEEVAELRRQREAVKAAGQQQQPGEAA